MQVTVPTSHVTSLRQGTLTGAQRSPPERSRVPVSSPGTGQVVKSSCPAEPNSIGIHTPRPGGGSGAGGRLLLLRVGLQDPAQEVVATQPTECIVVEGVDAGAERLPLQRRHPACHQPTGHA